MVTGDANVGTWHSKDAAVVEEASGIGAAVGTSVLCSAAAAGAIAGIGAFVHGVAGTNE